jgi:hypothetical protein
MKTKRVLQLFVILTCLFGLAGQGLAAKAVGYEELTATTGTAIGLTVATINSLSATYPDLWVIVQCQTYPAAYLWYGTPTSATVQQIATGDSIQFAGTALMKSFKAIGIGGSAKLAVNYFSGK